MDVKSIIDAVILGVVEGVTEFIPVSSTAHLLLVSRLLGFTSAGPAFEVLIQLGAILALLAVYAERLIRLVAALPRDRRTQRFVLGVVIAFLPSEILGVLFEHLITRVFFNSIVLIALALIIGGIALIAVDGMVLRKRYIDIMDYPLGLALGIGLFQCLSLVPGVSRSGATIAGALLLGTDKRSAAEYSFFLAMPTMAGAFAYELYKSIHTMDGSQAGLIAIGFVVAFLSALVVVRGFLAFVSRYGFAPFAWWRIAVGVAALIGVFFFGFGNGQPAAVADSGRPVTLELAAGAEAIEVGGQDRLEAGRLDAEAGERAPLGNGSF